MQMDSLANRTSHTTPPGLSARTCLSERLMNEGGDFWGGWGVRGLFPFTSAARVRIRPKRGYTDMSVECNKGGLEGGYGERVSPDASGAVCSGTSGVGRSQAAGPYGRARSGAGGKREGSAWIAGDVVSPGDGGGGGIGGGEGGATGLAAKRCATLPSPATPVGNAWRE